MSKFTERLNRISESIPYYTLALFLSCLSFSVEIVFIGDQQWLPWVIFSPFLILFPYLIFAVPLQIFLNKFPRRFSILYLIIYIIFSYLTVWLMNGLENRGLVINLFDTQKYNQLSLGAAIIFWFWDSICLQNKDMECV